MKKSLVFRINHRGCFDGIIFFRCGYDPEYPNKDKDVLCF